MQALVSSVVGLVVVADLRGGMVGSGTVSWSVGRTERVATGVGTS